LFSRVALTSFEGMPPAGIVNISIDFATGLAADASCADVVRVPVPEGTQVPPLPGCAGSAGGVVEGAVQWLRDLVR
jgi:hypothetical protein